MQLFRFLVLMAHPVTGKPTPIAALMAETQKQALRRAKQLYTESCWVQSEASHRVGAEREEKLLGRLRKNDRTWLRWEDDDLDEPA